MVLLRHISIAVTAAVAAIGSALFIALNYIYRRRIWSPEAEYCMIKEVSGAFFSSCVMSSVIVKVPQAPRTKVDNDIIKVEMTLIMIL